MRISAEVSEIINIAFSFAQSAHFEYVTPELVLYVTCQNKVFSQAFENCGGSINELDRDLRTYLDEYMESLEEDNGEPPEFSQGMGNVLAYASSSA